MSCVPVNLVLKSVKHLEKGFPFSVYFTVVILVWTQLSSKSIPGQAAVRRSLQSLLKLICSLAGRWLDAFPAGRGASWQAELSVMLSSIPRG